MERNEAALEFDGNLKLLETFETIVSPQKRFNFTFKGEGSSLNIWERNEFWNGKWNEKLLRVSNVAKSLFQVVSHFFEHKILFPTLCFFIYPNQT